MLGSGSSSTKSGKIKRIVKNGLQAWYKADKTQAPLGEEGIANGDFNEKGPDLIADKGGLTSAFTSGDFTHNSDGTMAINSDGVTNWSSGGVSVEGSKIYKVTVDIVSGTSGKFYIGGISSSLFSGTGINIRYIKSSASTNLGYVGFNDCNGMVVRSCSVEKIDPNDSWAVAGGWSMEEGKAVHSPMGDPNNDNYLSQANVYNQNTVKTYKVTYTITVNSGEFKFYMNGKVGTAFFGEQTSSGTYTVDFTTLGDGAPANGILYAAHQGSFDGSLTSISVKEVTNSVKDFSPNHNNAVLYSGKALSFDGSADYIDIDYWKSKTIDANTKATFAVWFNDDNVSSGDFIFGTNTSDSDFFYLGVIGSKLELGWHNSGWQADSNAIAVADNTWYRAVAVIDGLTCSVYINGELAFSKTTASSFTLHATGLSIGCQGNAVGDFWDGELADFQIYDKAWTASDVTYDWENPDKDVFDDESRVEVVSNVELVSSWTNSDFDSFNSSGSNITQMVSGASTNNCYSNSLTVTHGKTYRVEFTSSQNLGTSCQVRASALTSMSNADVISSSVSEGLNTFTFTAGGDRAYVGFGRAGAFTDTQITNFSFKEVTQLKAEILPTDCTALYRLNESAGDRLYNAAPVKGPEIVVDPTFSDDLTVATGGSGATPDGSGFAIQSVAGSTAVISDGVLTISNTGASGSDRGKVYISDGTNNSNNSFTGGATYFVEYEITEITGTPALTLFNGNGYENIPSTVGKHYWTFIAHADVSSNGIIFRNPTAGTTVKYTSLSFKKVTLSNSHVQTSWVSGNWKTAQPYIPQYAMSSYSKKMIFDGSDDCVTLGSKKTIAADEAFSLSFWFSANQDSTDEYVLGTDDVDSFLRINPGATDVVNFKSEGTTSTFDLDSGYTIGKINHVVLTIPAYSSGSEVQKFYFNGVLQADTQSRANTAFEYYSIGKSVGSSSNHFYEGFLDEVAYFSKELSATEVQEIFNAGMALDCRDHSAFLGSEEITDGDFALANNDNWSKSEQDSWTFSGGKASVDSTATAGLSQTLSGVALGKMYDISFEVSDYVKGQFQFAYDNFYVSGYPRGNVDANGTYSYRTIAQSSSPNIFLYGVDASKFSIDNLSVKEVDLKGYWRNNGLDEWTDLSPYGNNGTVSGSPTTIQLQEVPYFKKDTFGLPMNRVRERALNLDGGSYVTIDDSDDFNFGTTGFTIQAWVKPFSLVADDRIITKGTTDAAEWMISIGGDNSSVRVFAEDSGGAELDSENMFSAISLNTWAMITVVVDTPNNRILFYKDNGNVEVKTGVSWSGNFNGAAPLRIGANEALYVERFDGVIDDVKIYNRVLTQGEVTKNYKATKSKHVSTSNWSDDFSDSFI